MEFSASYIPYSETGAFTTIVTDYVAGAAALRPFYVHRPDRAGIEAAIAERQGFATDRASLVAHLRRQYAALPPSEAVAQQIHLLQQPLTFTVCTAHQPNIFTGHLYFVYKIIHAIKLAQHLQTILPQYRFVPVYYMGSEDADLAELGEVQVNGIRYHWPTQQTGAVGRMKVDAALVGLIAELSGQLLVLPHGPETVQLLRDCYTVGTTIEQATFQLVHRLFGHQGLVVLLPDHTDLKRAMLPVFQDDLLHHTAEGLVAATSAQLAVHYKAQAYPRPINLFYLADGIRERIERSEGGYRVVNTDLSFTEAELLQLLQEHPAHFSPNVILRGLYQETVLPNVAFVGGGGELAYWLQLKEVFAHYRVPYPVQVLRNSFVVMPEEMAHKAAMLGLTDPALFASETALLNDWVLRENEAALSLANEQEVLIKYYDQLGQKAAATDNTLHRHVMALQAKALQKIQDLEKKLMRAKKRQYEAERRHIHALKSRLFPSNRLQERVENVLPFLARYGNAFLTELHSYSPDLQQVMTILRKNG